MNSTIDFNAKTKDELIELLHAQAAYSDHIRTPIPKPLEH